MEKVLVVTRSFQATVSNGINAPFNKDVFFKNVVIPLKKVLIPPPSKGNCYCH